MKAFLVAAFVLASTAPIAIAPTPADAQVLAGRSAARAAERQRRPALSAREEDRLYASQDQISALEQQIAELETAGQAAGGSTPEQTTQLAAQRAQLAEAKTVVDRLEAKRARGSN